jgi:hypothetical protein
MLRWCMRWRVSAVLTFVLMMTTSSPTATAQGQDRWVQTHMPTELWSATGPEAISFGRVRQFSYLRLHGEQVGDRFYVYNPRTQNFAYVNAKAVGPSTPPPSDYLLRPRVLERLNVPGRAIGQANIWREPIADESAWLRAVEHNEPLMIRDAVEGEDGDTGLKPDLAAGSTSI